MIASGIVPELGQIDARKAAWVHRAASIFPCFAGACVFNDAFVIAVTQGGRLVFGGRRLPSERWIGAASSASARDDRKKAAL